MQRSFRYAFVALTLSGAFAVSCAPRSTTARPESEKNIVTAADIEQSPDMPLELLIQRKIPGVSVHNINGALVLQIRGATSVRTEQVRPPIYVLNGMRVPGGSSGEMPSVPARDIETIRVLKGSDAGLYGIEGADGVVVITTKGH